MTKDLNTNVSATMFKLFGIKHYYAHKTPESQCYVKKTSFF